MVRACAPILRTAHRFEIGARCAPSKYALLSCATTTFHLKLHFFARVLDVLNSVSCFQASVSRITNNIIRVIHKKVLQALLHHEVKLGRKPS